MGAEESALSTNHHLSVSSDSTLKAEPKSIPWHQDSNLLLPPIFSICCSLHKPSYAMFVGESRDGLSCRDHLKEQGLTLQHTGKEVSSSARAIGKSWTTWKTSPFPKLLLLNPLTSRTELKPPEEPCAPILAHAGSCGHAGEAAPSHLAARQHPLGQHRPGLHSLMHPNVTLLWISPIPLR